MADELRKFLCLAERPLARIAAMAVVSSGIEAFWRAARDGRQRDLIGTVMRPELA